MERYRLLTETQLMHEPDALALCQGVFVYPLELNFQGKLR